MDFFTIIDPISDKETILGIEKSKDHSHFNICIKETKFKIDHQQLAELGTLFLSMANSNFIDFSSVIELLDGFNLNTNNLKKVIEENN